MSGLLVSLAPVFLLILLGAALRRLCLFPRAFWDGAEQLTYFVLFPALLIASIARADYAGIDLVSVLEVVLGPTAAVAALLFIAKRMLGIDNRSFGSLLQGAIRTNTYVAIAIASALFPADGVSLMAFYVAVSVIAVNIFSVATLTLLHSRDPAVDHAGKRRSIIRQVLINPLVLACALGLALNAGRIELPAAIASLLDMLGRGALPIGLMVVGSALEFDSVKRFQALILLGTAAKLLVLPALAWIICRAIDLTGPSADLAILYAGVPTSASAFVLARQLGGDVSLMSALITVQTMAAAISLSVLLALQTLS